jgi:CheY-like chemotaxis protein
VLVIDDEETVCTAIERILDDTHDVVSAVKAGDALAMLAEGALFDVILCDLMMPEMTGMEVHERLSSSSPTQAEQMVFLTGGAFTQAARAFLDRVPNARIEKPFALADLLTVVNERVK